jgi:hypothetical protein
MSIVLACALSGCLVPEPNGESLGTFEVEGTLLSNGCGRDAVPAQDRFVFEVDVRDDGHIVYWRRAGSPMVMGLRNGGALEFQTTINHRIQAAGQRCVLAQRETVRVVVETGDGGDGGANDASVDAGALLDAGVPSPASLTGTNTIRFSEVDSALCEGLLEAEGGEFLALPCTLDYVLSGTGTEPF